MILILLSMNIHTARPGPRLFGGAAEMCLLDPHVGKIRPILACQTGGIENVSVFGAARKPFFANSRQAIA
jgi:hypothetical protein